MSSPTADGRIDASDVKGAWERIKAEEKAERAAGVRRNKSPPVTVIEREDGTTGADTGDGIAAQGVQRRLRLERSARGAAQDSRGSRRDRNRARSRRCRELAAKPAISCSHWSTWRGMSAPIRKWRCVAPTPNSNGALATSNGAGGAGAFARRRVACRDGRVVERRRARSNPLRVVPASAAKTSRDHIPRWIG